MDLYDFYTKILKIQDKEILKELVSLSKNKYYDKGKNIFKYDDEVTHTQFLVKGIIRGYFLDENGNEITDCFCTRCGSPTVIRYGSEIIPAVSLEALTECEIISIPINKIEELQHKYIEVSLLYNNLLLEAFAEHWEAKTTLYRYTAMERYKWFLSKYPGLIDQISNKYIASYLNITPVTLSRLRSELNRQRVAVIRK
ncbi:MAG: Crp/Fnr family transcriptional regulator [Acutalibacteraceae bacterium]